LYLLLSTFWEIISLPQAGIYRSCLLSASS